MTRKEILAIPAGRELNSLVAEKAMGKEVKVWQDGTTSIRIGVGFDYVPDYSNNVSASFLVVDRLDALGWDFKLSKSGRYCEVSFGDKAVVRESVTHAICLCALLAVMDA